MYGVTGLEKLVGQTVKFVRMNEDYLSFETFTGTLNFKVYGDCCSHSYFFDFLGVDKLLRNGPVVSVGTIDVVVTEDNREYDDYVQAYGYEIVTEDPLFGPVTSVFSFRNASNGYYGGEMVACDRVPDDLPILTGDLIG